MERSLALGSIESDCRRLCELVETNESIAVASCPGWTVQDLAEHLAGVYGWVTATISGEEYQDHPAARETVPDRPSGEPVATWLATCCERLLGAFDAVPRDASRWNFRQHSGGPVSFWWRRQAHETLIHRADAELACGETVSTTRAQIASDGVTEYLEMISSKHAEVDWHDLVLGDAMTVHLHATDDVVDAEWTIDTAGKAFARAHLKADVALRGPAFLLDLWCWRRLSVDKHSEGLGLEAFGDIAAAEAWRPRI